MENGVCRKAEMYSKRGEVAMREERREGRAERMIKEGKDDEVNDQGEGSQRVIESDNEINNGDEERVYEDAGRRVKRGSSEERVRRGGGRRRRRKEKWMGRRRRG